MGLMSVLSYAQKIVTEHVRSGDTVIDATVGNGVDTLCLARLVGAKGIVIGFDIQTVALENTKNRLLAQQSDTDEQISIERFENGHIRLIHDSHQALRDYLDERQRGQVAAVMFNLGFLPNSGQQHLITTPETTLPALDAALEVIRPNGVVTIVLYPGHEGGAEEAAAVQSWAGGLSQRMFDVLLYRMLNKQRSAPYLIAIQKKLNH